MSKSKRFEKSKSCITDYRIYDYEKEDAYFIDCDDESTVDAIVNLLNKQNRELDNRKQIIKTLTQEYKELEVAHNESIKESEMLAKENEQLREDRKVANDFIVKKGLDVEYYKHWRGLQDE